MFRITLPALAAPGGTRTPSTPASTSRYGDRPLSLIHSYSARNRYGRLGVIGGGFTPAPGTRTRNSRAQALLFGGQTAREPLAAEDAFTVVGDRLRLARQLHAKR